MDSVSGESTGPPLLLVDVRSEEEVAVSTIPGALHIAAVEDKTQPHGWWVVEHSQLLGGPRNSRRGCGSS